MLELLPEIPCDLGSLAREGLDVRSSAVVEAEAIIETEVGDFMQWLDNRALVPTIRALRVSWSVKPLFMVLRRVRGSSHIVNRNVRVMVRKPCTRSSKRPPAPA